MSSPGRNLPPEFPTWQAALEAATPEGYQDQELVETIVRKTWLLGETMAARPGVSGLLTASSFRKRLQQRWVLALLRWCPVDRIPRFVQNRVTRHEFLRTLGAVAWARRKGEVLRVLDFGGGAGHHYLQASAFFPRLPLRWNVVETTAMASAAAQRFRPGLKFFHDAIDARTDLGTVDLLFASGSVHCCADPAERLALLASLGARNIVITRTCFVDGQRSHWILQKSRLSENGPGPLPAGFRDREVTYPNSFIPKSKALEILVERYRKVLFTKENKNIFALRSELVDMYGFWGQLP